VDDPDPDGNVAYTIITAPATGAPEYAGINPADVSVTNQDNDGQGNYFESQDVPQNIADPHPRKGPKPATSELVIESTGITVDLIDVDVSIDHASMSDLTVPLTSPSNTEAALGYDGAWDLVDAAAFNSEPLDGTWLLTVTDTQKNGITGTLQAWSMTVTPLTEGAAASSQSAAAVDIALMAWAGLESSDDEDIDPLATQAADELALMLFE